MELSPATRIAVIGAGKMGEAMLAGWLGATSGPAASFGPDNFIVANPGQDKRERIARTYGVACVADACEIQRANIVVLAVKPQIMDDVLSSIRDSAPFAAQDPLYVSVAAGISTARMEGSLGGAARVVRCMPNSPLSIGNGATGVCGGANSTPEDVSLVCDLFSSIGTAFAVEEQMMDAVCAVSGSGPAYMALMIETMRDAGMAEGLSEDAAEQLALVTMWGTAEMLCNTKMKPEQARQAACTPGGTTIAALEAMQAAGFREAVVAGVHAAAKRSAELGAS